MCSNTLDPEDIAVMRRLGAIAGSILRRLKRAIRPGMATKEIEQLFDKYLSDYAQIESAFLGYNGYPASICVSVNEEIIHGIPHPGKVLKQGDLVSVDLGLKHQGLFVDCAYTYIIGKASSLEKKMVKVCKRALIEGIKRARIGNTIGDIGSAIQKFVESNGFSVIRRFVGHGIGRALHCPPEVPNFGIPASGTVLREGMALAIEPMISAGSFDIDILADGWTAKTSDNSLSCHFEHTIVITRKGPQVLTK